MDSCLTSILIMFLEILKCPITQEQFQDPVVAAGKHLYIRYNSLHSHYYRLINTHGKRD